MEVQRSDVLRSPEHDSQTPSDLERIASSTSSMSLSSKECVLSLMRVPLFLMWVLWVLLSLIQVPLFLMGVLLSLMQALLQGPVKPYAGPTAPYIGL